MVLWWVACASGNLATPQGSDPVMTAFHLQELGAESDALHVLVSNSLVSSCELPDPDDRDAYEELYLATRREGTRIARLTLHRFRQASWEGDYPLSAEPVATLLSERDPFIAEASWYSVLEAQVTDEDGLVMEYEPTDVQAMDAIPSGDVRVTRDDDGVRGEFGFETLDVSGSFSTQPCGTTYDNSIFTLVDLLGPAIDDLVD